MANSWVTTVDHKRLGLMYIGYALVFLVIGGIEAAIMRIQLLFGQVHGRHARAGLDVVGVPDPAPKVLSGVGRDA